MKNFKLSNTIEQQKVSKYYKEVSQLMESIFQETNEQIMATTLLREKKFIKKIATFMARRLIKNEQIIKKYNEKIRNLNIIANRYEYITNRIFEIDARLKALETSIDEKINRCNPNYSKNIECLQLKNRTLNALHSEKIYTIAKLVSLSEIDLMGFPKFSKGSLEDVKEKLAMFGMVLKDYRG